MMGNVPTDLQGMGAKEKEVWGDVQSRALMAKNLILDTNAGMLDMMVSSSLFSCSCGNSHHCPGLKHLPRPKRPATRVRRRDHRHRSAHLAPSMTQPTICKRVCLGTRIECMLHDCMTIYTSSHRMSMPSSPASGQDCPRSRHASQASTLLAAAHCSL